MKNFIKDALVFSGLDLSPQRAFETMVRVGHKLCPDYRFTWPQMAWWWNDAFNKYLTRFGEDGGFNTQRRWALAQLLRLVHDIQGDTVECGVYEGCSSWLIIEANKRSPHRKVHHIFDSFEGVSEPGPSDGRHWSKNDLSAGEAAVQRNLPEGTYVIHKGWIPERFAEVDAKRFSFVHVDVDLAQPTEDSVRFFYDRMNDGAILLCDDYGFTTCPGATAAVDNFLRDKREKMISLPDGGGFFIKGTVCASAL
jgi:O-methyltransferase